MIRGNIILLGTSRIKREFAKQKVNADAAFRQGLLKGGQFLLSESKKIVPYKTGALSKSGYAVNNPDRTIAPNTEVGFGDRRKTILGAAGHHPKNYAVEQHENLEYFHKGNREAKYLLTPVLVRQRDIVKTVKKAFEKYILRKKNAIASGKPIL
jgi:hypothetical protein